MVKKWSQLVVNAGKWSQMVANVANGRNWSQVVSNCRKCPKCRKWSQIIANGLKWSQLVANGRTWSQIVANGRKWSQLFEKVDVQTLLLLEKSQLVVSSYNLISLADAYCPDIIMTYIMLC